MRLYRQLSGTTPLTAIGLQQQRFPNGDVVRQERVQGSFMSRIKAGGLCATDGAAKVRSIQTSHHVAQSNTGLELHGLLQGCAHPYGRTEKVAVVFIIPEVPSHMQTIPPFLVKVDPQLLWGLLRFFVLLMVVVITSCSFACTSSSCVVIPNLHVDRVETARAFQVRTKGLQTGGRVAERH